MLPEKPAGGGGGNPYAKPVRGIRPEHREHHQKRLPLHHPHRSSGGREEEIGCGAYHRIHDATIRSPAKRDTRTTGIQGKGQRRQKQVPLHEKRRLQHRVLRLADGGDQLPSQHRKKPDRLQIRTKLPFEEYFYGLKPHDGKTDYIAQLAATIKTTNQPFWEDCLKRWLVGMVACALDDNVENQLAIIMKGEQGKGKSSWIRHLLPPELSKYYRNGMINPDNKDHMLFLSQCLLINLEEFEGMTGRNISELKRLIVQDVVTERRPFDTDANSYIRHCSFIASTNEPRFLKDPGGAFRRYPTVTVEEIDFHTPVNHAGIYSQALYLWKSGFHYWYENDEITTLNEVNREYSLASIEEELLYVYFRKPKADDFEVKWMPVSAILVLISMNGKIQMNDRNQKSLVQILERDKFRKRISENKIYEYEVVQYSFDEVDRNYKKIPSSIKQETQEELPF